MFLDFEPSMSYKHSHKQKNCYEHVNIVCMLIVFCLHPKHLRDFGVYQQFANLI